MGTVAHLGWEGGIKEGSLENGSESYMIRNRAGRLGTCHLKRTHLTPELVRTFSVTLYLWGIILLRLIKVG